MFFFNPSLVKRWLTDRKAGWCRGPGDRFLHCSNIHHTADSLARFCHLCSWREEENNGRSSEAGSYTLPKRLLVAWNICRVQSNLPASAEVTCPQAEAYVCMDSAHWGSRERTLSELEPKPRRPAWKNRYLLANHVSRILVNEAGRSVAPETLVHFAFVSLKPGGTHALHVSAAGQRAGLGGHAVVMADVCSGRSGEQMRNQEHFTVSRSGWNSTGF